MDRLELRAATSEVDDAGGGRSINRPLFEAFCGLPDIQVLELRPCMRQTREVFILDRRYIGFEEDIHQFDGV